MSNKRVKSLLLTTTMIAGTSLSGTALAQGQPAPALAQPPASAPGDPSVVPAPAAPNDGTTQSGSTKAAVNSQEIVITGTLIRNPNLVASAPVTVLGHDEVQLRQAHTAEEVLRTIPGAAPSTGSQVNNGNGGSFFVNLRSLGSNRNIVLLDGVRIVPADLLGRVDLNNIPLGLVDRVDVLTGGASSTYGADAVAGVINFITRNDFSGVEVSVSDQITERGDGNFLRGDLALGANFNDGRGNAVMSMTYQESDPVYQGGDRTWSSLALNSSAPGNLALAGSSTTTPSAFDFTNLSGRYQVGPTGNTLVPFYQSFNFNPYNLFQTQFKQYNLFTAGHYDVGEHLTVYGRGLFNNNTVESIVAPSGAFADDVTIPLSNPFMSAQQRQLFCTDLGLSAAQCTAAASATSPTDPNFRTDTVQLRRRTTEVGTRNTIVETNMFDFRAGLRGDVTDKIGFDVYAARGISNRVQTVTGFIRLSRLRQALMATNSTTCLDPSNGCIPVNIFGPSGSITPAMVPFLTDAASFLNRVELSQGHGTISGDTPLQLWGKNPVSFAIGAEYRKYRSEQQSDALAKTAGELGGAGGAAPDINGGFDVYEGFAEVVAPIVSDRPLFDELQLEAGIRRSHYTVATPTHPKFDTTTWKIAGSWAPVRDIKFRGNYQQAVRAPNIAELFTPVSTGLVNLAADPCAGAAPLSNPNLAAVCLAQGAPASRLGVIQNPTAGQANITSGGNLNLRPEKAKTLTVGAVIRPHFLPGFSGTVDYYNIKVKDAITLPTPGDIINACFGALSAASATSPACTAIRRNGTTGALDGSPASVPGLFGILSNLGRLSTDGIDLTIDYRHSLGMILGTPAKLSLSFGGNYTHSQKFQATPTSIDRECVGFYSANCGYPAGALDPKYSFNERSTLTLGRVDLSLLWRHLSAMRYEPGLPPLFSGTVSSTSANPLNGQTVNFNRIPAFDYFDFASRFNVSEHLTVTLTVANLFNRKPPIVGNTAGTTTFNSGNTFPSTYDPLGRRFAAGVRLKF